MSNNQFARLLLALVLLLGACKKSSDNPDTAYSADFTHTGGIGTNSSVTFTANAPSGSTVSWDFGDGSTGAGITATHQYNGYGCYPVKMVASRNSQSYTITKSTAISPYAHVYISGVMIEQIPPFGPGGVDWDPGDNPDLGVIILRPGQQPDTIPVTLSNSVSGLISFPALLVNSYEQNITVELTDNDPGGLTKMSSVQFRLCDYIGSTMPFNTSLTVENTTTRIKAIVSWNL